MKLVISIHSIEGVTVHEVKLLTDSGKSDYAQVGEGVIFSCLYILDPDEVILSIVWEKDKEQVSPLPVFSLHFSFISLSLFPCRIFRQFFPPSCFLLFHSLLCFLSMNFLFVFDSRFFPSVTFVDFNSIEPDFVCSDSPYYSSIFFLSSSFFLLMFLSSIWPSLFVTFFYFRFFCCHISFFSSNISLSLSFSFCSWIFTFQSPLISNFFLPSKKRQAGKKVAILFPIHKKHVFLSSSIPFLLFLSISFLLFLLYLLLTERKDKNERRRKRIFSPLFNLHLLTEPVKGTLLLFSLFFFA